MPLKNNARGAASCSDGTWRYPWRWRLSDLPEPGHGAPTAFSMFACGGGSSMGYKRAGFRVLGNCEIDPNIAAMYEKNLAPEFSFVMDARQFVEADGLPEPLFNLDVLDGSPPCTPFSTAGDRQKSWGKEKVFAEGQKLQTLDDLMMVYAHAVAKFMPKCFVAENVPGILHRPAKGYAAEFVRFLQGAGYAVQVFVLDASRMGVPQQRLRVFFVGNRIGKGALRLEFDEPPIAFGGVRTQHGGKPFKEDSDYVANMRHVMPGEKNQKHAKRRAGKSQKYSNYNNTVYWDGYAASTLTASGCFARACDLCHLSEGDFKAVSSFPQDYDFCGRDPQFVCGMSVPPSMMANVAHEIRRQWLDG